MGAVKDLVICAVSLGGQPLSSAITARFDVRGGTVGRSDSNTLALPDPRRHISRLQAEVLCQGGRYSLRNAGNANPITVNQTALAPGQASPLMDGDEMQVGAYVLRVTLEEPLAAVPPNPQAESKLPAHTVIMASAAEPKTNPRRPSDRASTLSPHSTRPHRAPSSGLPGSGGAGFGAEIGAELGGNNPFADLLGPSTSSRGAGLPVSMPSDRSRSDTNAAVGGGTGAKPAQAADAGSRSRSPLPADYDPFAEPVTGGPVTAGPGGGTSGKALDDTFANPFASLAAPPAASTVDSRGEPHDPFKGLLPQNDASLDEMFGLGPSGAAANRNLLGDFMADDTMSTPPTDPRAGVRDVPPRAAPTLDPLAMFDAPGTRARADVPVTVVPDHTPQLQAAFRPPVVGRAPGRSAAPAQQIPDDLPAHTVIVPPPPDGPPPPAAPRPSNERNESRAESGHPASANPMQEPVAAATASNPRDAAALWRAFERGAGLGRMPDEALTPELMTIIGQLLRTSVDGTLQLMAARTATKQELRAQVTVIQPRDNNPLKFTPDGQAALDQMLRPPVRGFMPATEAMQDAMDDLLGHAVGTMAGMRAALHGVLARFTPAQLEAALTEPSVLQKLLPMNRNAKLWELYLAHHARVQAEAEDKFGNLFGVAFVKAYEEQLNALDRTRTGQGQVMQGQLVQGQVASEDNANRAAPARPRATPHP